MPATFTIPLITVISGQTITATLWNNEFENIDSNFTPAGMDDYSATDTQMRAETDPYPGGATSRPTSLQGEMERIRYVIGQITGNTYWYIDPVTTIAALSAKFPIQSADIGGDQVTATHIANQAVLTTKIADLNVTNAKINDVAASKITGTISTSQIGDTQVTYAKLASDVTSKLSPKSIQRSTATVNFQHLSGANNSQTINVTISSVDTSKAYVILNGDTIVNGDTNIDATDNIVRVKAQLTSSTNVEVIVTHTGTTSANNWTGTVYFTVVEWN